MRTFGWDAVDGTDVVGPGERLSWPRTLGIGVQDAAAPPVVVNRAGAFVLDPLARPIGGGGGRAVAFAAPDDFGAEAVDRQGGKVPLRNRKVGESVR